MFSQQDKKQIIGRIHRMPQLHPCIAYDLVLGSSSDETLYAMACEKAELMAALNGQTVRDIMRNIGSVEEVPGETDEMMDYLEYEMEADSFLSQGRGTYRIAAAKARLEGTIMRNNITTRSLHENGNHDSASECLATARYAQIEDSSVDDDALFLLGLEALSHKSLEETTSTPLADESCDHDDSLFLLGLEAMANVPDEALFFDSPGSNGVTSTLPYNESSPNHESKTNSIRLEDECIAVDFNADDMVIDETLGAMEDIWSNSHHDMTTHGTTAAESNRRLLMSSPPTEMSFALPSSSYVLEDCESGLAPRTWSQGTVRPTKRLTEEDPVRPWKRITGHSTWGLRLNELRPVIPRPQHQRLRQVQALHTSRADEASSLTEVSAAGGALNYLSQLSAQLEAEDQQAQAQRNTPTVDATTDMHAQRSSSYSFTSAAHFY